MSLPKFKEKPWYKDGLPFECTGCGKCCTGAPGYVFVTVEEIEALSKELSLSIQEFSRLYVRRVGERFSLIERPAPSGYACVFLEGKLCKVYGARPKQCRTFPFWEGNLKSKEAWERCASECEGIHDGARVVSYEEIIVI